VEIQHDKGRLSEEEIQKLQAEAEQFAEADELRAQMFEAKMNAEYDDD
jgi:molecular chaperone DnaK (HSP70)